MNTTSATDSRSDFEQAIHLIQGEMAAFSFTLRHEARLRALYSDQINRMAKSLVEAVEQGKHSWQSAAQEAVEMRNLLLEAGRGKSGPLGRALAENLKLNPKSFNEIVASALEAAHGPGVSFQHLLREQQDRVFASMIQKAGRSRGTVDRWMLRAGKAAKPLMFFVVATTLYEVATADDWQREAVHQGVGLGAGAAGYVAGGVIGGILCGPAAPLCVGAGAFVGGAVAAYLAEQAWE